MTPRVVIFDLDGTVYRGSELVSGAAEAIGYLRAQGIFVRFLTNNSAATRSEIAAKLCRLGIEAYEDECFGTAWATARHLVQGGITTVYAVGEAGLVESLRDAGIAVSDVQSEAVVVGICRDFTYSILNEAMQQCRGGAVLIATNTDASYPVAGGLEQPGAGAIVSAVETATGQRAKVIGKPDPFMIHEILRECDLDADQCLVVGDRLETDIEAAHRAGCSSFLVLSGVTTVAPKGQASGATLLDMVRWIGV